MITCPNCDKEVADDTVHCGYCGHKIKEEGGQKKTMFGMAALGGDDLKKAVEEAKRAKQDEAESSKGGGFKLPSPKPSSAKSSSPGSGASEGASSGAGFERSGSGRFALPKPGEKSEAEDTADDEAKIASAKTELLDAAAQEELKKDLERRRADESQTTRTPDAPATPEPAAPVDTGTEPPAAAAAEANYPADAGAANVTPGPSQVAPAGDQKGPLAPSADVQPEVQQHAAGPGEHVHGTRPPYTGEPAEKSSKKGIIIAIIAVVMLFGGACVIGIGYVIYTNLL